MQFSKILLVGLGGFAGSAARYMISTSTSKFFGTFPLGTLLVNIIGGFLIGLILEAGTNQWSLSDGTRAFLTTGIMGGLTTFSTFSYETVSLFGNGEYLMGGMNAGLNLFCALFACWLGKTVARFL